MARHANSHIDLSDHSDNPDGSRRSAQAREAMRAKLAQDMADYLAAGGSVTELADGKIRSTYKPAFNRNPEYQHDDR